MRASFPQVWSQQPLSPFERVVRRESYRQILFPLIKLTTGWVSLVFQNHDRSPSRNPEC
jgi:hypothetical protein